MARGRRRKCKCCGRLFRPDPGNRRHQCYRSAPRCRRASKTASHARWLARAENHDYFRGPAPTARPGELVIPAIGARCRVSRRSLKTSLRRKTLILLEKVVFFARAPLQDGLVRTK